jgi:phospholipid/cholesterol/gamma-HCH transport system substrate-binding protein
MKALTKEVKIALVAIAGVVILFFGMNFLKGLNLFSSTND